MNHLTAIAKIREIIGTVADDFVIAHWERRVRCSDEPEKVLAKLKETVKTANEFWEWTSTLPGVEQILSWRRNAEHTYLLIWGDTPGALEGAKKEFIANYMEDLESLEKAFKEWMKGQILYVS